MLDAVIVGQAIRACRMERHLSQEVVSGLAGIGRTHLCAIEHGVRRPTLETFFRLAEAMNVAPHELTYRIEQAIQSKKT